MKIDSVNFLSVDIRGTRKHTCDSTYEADIIMMEERFKAGTEIEKMKNRKRRSKTQSSGTNEWGIKWK